MTAKTKPDFYSVALAAKEPRGDYATAREMLDDLPAIVMRAFGAEGARIANYMVRHNKSGWRRSNRRWFDREVAFAANALLRNPHLPPDQKVHFELMVLIGGVFDAVDKKKKPHIVIETTGIEDHTKGPATPKQALPPKEAKERKLARLRGELNLKGYKVA